MRKENKTEKATVNKRFKLSEDIKDNDLYRSSKRDPKARKIIKENIDNAKKGDILPGQLLTFNYFNPKTKDELEFYDASPCTIFFGIFNSQQGKRVLGFNIHYFPPKLRYNIMDNIYEMYRPVYQKYFESGLSHELDAFDYSYLVDELDKYNMSFAVRMYDPKLIGDVRVIPPKWWATAIFTEGWFKKETRARILQLFKQDSINKNKKYNIRRLHYKRKK